MQNCHRRPHRHRCIDCPPFLHSIFLVQRGQARQAQARAGNWCSDRSRFNSLSPSRLTLKVSLDYESACVSVQRNTSSRGDLPWDSVVWCGVSILADTVPLYSRHLGDGRDCLSPPSSSTIRQSCIYQCGSRGQISPTFQLMDVCYIEEIQNKVRN